MEDFPALAPPPGTLNGTPGGTPLRPYPPPQQQHPGLAAQPPQQPPQQPPPLGILPGAAFAGTPGLSAAAIVAGGGHPQTLAHVLQHGMQPDSQLDHASKLRAAAVARDAALVSGKDVPPQGPLGVVGKQQQPQQQQQQPLSAGSVGSGTPRQTTQDTVPAGATPPVGTESRFGIYGLVDILRMHNTDTSMFSVGYDLMSLGLNLNSAEPLGETFMSPFAATPSLGADPQFKIPSFYDLQHPPPQPTAKVASFSDETLFYIFYAMPRETLQEIAAQELYNRNWRFHKELKLWLSKDINTETIKGSGGEKGVFIFFDPSTWTRVKKEWIVYYDHLEERYIATAPNGDGIPSLASGSGVEPNADQTDVDRGSGDASSSHPVTSKVV